MCENSTSSRSMELRRRISRSARTSPATSPPHPTLIFDIVRTSVRRVKGIAKLTRTWHLARQCPRPYPDTFLAALAAAHRPGDLALGVALGDRLPLVVLLLASPQAHLHLRM